jgi:hypothetical protein
MSAPGQEHRFERSDPDIGFPPRCVHSLVTVGTLDKFGIIKLAATTLSGTGGASVTRSWIGAISPPARQSSTGLGFIGGGGKGDPEAT